MKNVIPYNSLLWGIGAIVVGLLLMFNPANAIILATRMIGILSLTIGVIQLGVQLVVNRKTETKTFPLSAIISIVWGALLLIRPVFWTQFFMIVLGLLMMFLAINQISTYRQISKGGLKVSFAYYIFPLLLLISGILTIIEPVFLAEWIVIFVACWILAYGAVEIASYFALKKR